MLYYEITVRQTHHRAVLAYSYHPAFLHNQNLLGNKISLTFTGATEALSKTRHVESARPPGKPHTTAALDQPGSGNDEGQLADQAEPALGFSNAAHLRMGQTEVLVAPGLKPPGQQEADQGQSEQARVDESTAAEDAQAGAQPASLALDLDMEGDADGAIGESHLEGGKAASGQGQLTPGQQSDAQIPAAPAQQDQNHDAEEVGGDCDMHRASSDGADSYQGLPDDTAAQSTLAGEGLEEGDSANLSSSMDPPVVANPAAGADATPADEQQHLESGSANVSAGGMPKHAPEPAGEPHPDGQLAQIGVDRSPAVGMKVCDSQPAVHSPGVKAEGTARDHGGRPDASAVEEGPAQPMVPQLGSRVEVCCRPAPGQWKWQAAVLQSAVVPTSGLVTVTYLMPPSAASSSARSELVDVSDVRRVATEESYITALSSLQKGAAVEVDTGDGNFLCGVLVAKVQPLQSAWGLNPAVKKRVASLEEVLSHAHELQCGGSLLPS